MAKSKKPSTWPLNTLGWGSRRDWGRGHDSIGRSVRVVQGNARLIQNAKRSFEDGTQIRVFFAAVPRVPTEVDVEAQKIGKPFSDFRCVDPRRCTACQSSELIKVDRLCAAAAKRRRELLRARESKFHTYLPDLTRSFSSLFPFPASFLWTNMFC
jgi:hypothetical protein